MFKYDFDELVSLLGVVCVELLIDVVLCFVDLVFDLIDWYCIDC